MLVCEKVELFNKARGEINPKAKTIQHIKCVQNTFQKPKEPKHTHKGTNFTNTSVDILTAIPNEEIREKKTHTHTYIDLTWFDKLPMSMRI